MNYRWWSFLSTLFLFLFITPSLSSSFSSSFSSSPSFSFSRQTIGYEYVLENECRPTLENSRIIYPPEFQQIVFNFIALNISDVRMYPSDCRRPLLWFLCSLAFPLAQPLDTADSCHIGIEECLYVSEACFGQIDCSFLQKRGGVEGMWRGVWEEIGGGEEEEEEEEEELERWEERGDDEVCEALVESVDIPVEVQTCLKNANESIECCFDPYIQADKNGECVVKCPVSPWDQDTLETVSLVIFGLMWFSIFCAFVGLFPLLFLKNATDFPKALVPIGIITVNVWTLTKMWGVFVGIEEYVCGDEEDGIIGLSEFLDSPTCSAQMFFVNYIAALVCMEMISVSFLFVLMMSNPTLKDVTNYRYPIYFLIIVPPLVVSIIVTVLVEAGGYEDLKVTSIANSCQTNLSQDIGYILTVYYTISFGLTYIFTFLGIFFVFRRSWQLLRVHVKPVFFLAWMIYISSLLIVVFYYLFPEEENVPTDLEAGLFCVATHPRDKDAPCRTEFMDNFVFFSFVEFSIVIAPTICVIVLFWNELTFHWWKILIFEQEIISSMENITREYQSRHGSMDDFSAASRDASAVAMSERRINSFHQNSHKKLPVSK